MADRLTQKDIELAEEGVQTAKRHKKYIRDKYKKVKGYFKEMLNSETSSNQDRLTEADIKLSAGPFLGAKPVSTDRMTERDQEYVNKISERMGSNVPGMRSGGSVKSRGCKMGRNKLTKIY